MIEKTLWNASPRKPSEDSRGNHRPDDSLMKAAEEYKVDKRDDAPNSEFEVQRLDAYSLILS